MSKDIFVYALYVVIAAFIFRLGYFAGRYTDHNEICIFLQQFCKISLNNINQEI